MIEAVFFDVFVSLPGLNHPIANTNKEAWGTVFDLCCPSVLHVTLDVTFCVESGRLVHDYRVLDNARMFAWPEHCRPIREIALICGVDNHDLAGLGFKVSQHKGYVEANRFVSLIPKDVPGRQLTLSPHPLLQ